MRVPGNSVMPTIHALQTAMDKAAQGKRATGASPAASAGVQDRDVQISGEALLKQRLFDFMETEGKPGVQTERLPAPSLTWQDKQLLGDIYEWARDEGAQLGYVDSLGRALANYRSGITATNDVKPEVKSDPQVESKPKPQPKSRLTFREDAAVKRMLTGDALKTTRLDAGFIRHATSNPAADRSPYQMEFMEKVINRFSAQGDKAPPLGSMFSNGADKPRASASTGEGRTTQEASVKRKPLTLESLRLERVQSALKMLGVSRVSQLWDNLLSGSRFRR